MTERNAILLPHRPYRRAAFRRVVDGVARGEMNHGLSRTGFARPLATLLRKAPHFVRRATRRLRRGRIYARPVLDWRKRKRSASVFVRGLEHRAVAHELGKVCVDDAVAPLDGIVAREDVLGIVVSNLLQRGVFAVFRFTVGHHRHADLYVGVIGIATTQNEIALKRADAPDACGIAMCTGVCENGVFKRGTVVDAVVGVGGKVESEVGKIVFLLATYGLARFEVESLTLVEDLRIFQNAYVLVQGFALDVRSRLFKFAEDVFETGRCPEVVDEIRLNFLEHGKVADFYAAADILFENLGDDSLDVCPAVIGSIVLKRLRKTTATQILIELIHKVGGDSLAEKFFHAKELVESEREHFKLKVSSGKFRDEFAAQEIGVGAGDEDGMPPFDTKGIDHLLKSFYILDFVNEEVGRAGRRRLFINEPFKLIGGFDVLVGTAVKVEIDNVRIVNAALSQLAGNCFHKAGFPTASDAGYNLYESRVFIKATNLAQVVFSFVVVHGEQYSISAAKSQVKGVDFRSVHEFTPLTRLLAPRRTSCRAAFRRVAGGVAARLQRTRGADEKMSVSNGDDFRDVALHAVDDAIVAKENLADVRAAEFPDHAAGKRKFREMRNRFEYIVFPIPRRRPVAAFLGDMLDALCAAQTSAFGPADHSPISLLRRARSACAFRISSSCVVNSPRSNSVSAAQRSSMSSSVSRMLSKSATSMRTFEATPFCVTSSGRLVFVLRVKHSAIVLRNVEKVTTSSARRIVFKVRSSTGMGTPFGGLEECEYCTISCTSLSRRLVPHRTSRCAGPRRRRGRKFLKLNKSESI